MEIHLTREQEARITALAAKQGRSLDDVVGEAVDAWTDRQTILANLRASLDAAEADLSAGRGEEITAQTERAFLDGVKRDGRARSQTIWQPSRAV